MKKVYEVFHKGSSVCEVLASSEKEAKDKGAAAIYNLSGMSLKEINYKDIELV